MPEDFEAVGIGEVYRLLKDTRDDITKMRGDFVPLALYTSERNSATLTLADTKASLGAEINGLRADIKELKDQKEADRRFKASSVFAIALVGLTAIVGVVTSFVGGLIPGAH